MVIRNLLLGRHLYMQIAHYSEFCVCRSIFLTTMYLKLHAHLSQSLASSISSGNKIIASAVVKSPFIKLSLEEHRNLSAQTCRHLPETEIKLLVTLSTDTEENCFQQIWWISKELIFFRHNMAHEETMRFSRFQRNGWVLIFDVNGRKTWYVYSKWTN